MKKKSFFVGASALLLMASMNLGHALNEYGFLNGNLCGSILAQTTTTGSGNTSTGGGGSTGGSSSSGTGGGNSTNSSSTSGSTSNREKIKQYRPDVACRGEYIAEGHVSISITINGVKLDLGEATFDAGAKIPYTGTTEKCTGGNDWYDCDGVQTDCIPNGLIGLL